MTDARDGPCMPVHGSRADVCDVAFLWLGCCCWTSPEACGFAVRYTLQQMLACYVFGRLERSGVS